MSFPRTQQPRHEPETLRLQDKLLASEPWFPHVVYTAWSKEAGQRC